MNQKEEKGIFGVPSTTLVIFVVVTAVFVIIYSVSGVSKVSVETGEYQRSLNKYLVNPELILGSNCVTVERGVFNYSKLKENNCGFNCLSPTSPVNLTIKSSKLNLKKSCLLGPEGWNKWTYANSYPVLISKRGNYYPATLVIRS